MFFLISIFKMITMKTKAAKTNRQDLHQTNKPISSGLYEKHFRRPIEQPFYKDETAHTTILIGGLSATHDKLIAAALNSLGIKAEAFGKTH